MSRSERARGIVALTELGMTELEALAYSALVTSSPATGYGVARAIGKPVANTYKALASLERRGAVLLDDARERLYRAVPPGEWLAQLRAAFDARSTQAKRALDQLRTTAGDDRIYSLGEVAQVHARAREMLKRATTVALIDAFPGPYAAIAADVRAAAKRGVWVALKVYAPIDAPGCLVVTERTAVRDAWPAQWLNITVDAAEHLVALLDADGAEVVQAIWSASQVVSWVYHCGLAAEIFLTRLLVSDDKVPAYRAVIEEFRDVPFATTPGRRGLDARLTGTAPTPPARGRSARGRRAAR